MASTTLAYRSSLRISSLSRSVESVGKVFENAQQTTNAIAATMSSQNEIKRKSISDKTKYFLARREAVRRREQESIIEASSIGGSIKRAGKVVAESTKGFLGRILDFVGTLLVGWLVLNLPVIIDGAKKLIERMQKLVTVMSSAVGNITDFLFSFGQTLGNVLVDVASFNFGNINNSITDGMNKMNESLRRLENDVIQGFDLLTDPIDFGFDNIIDGLGDDGGGGAPPPGEYTPGGIEGPETSGGKVNPQAVYQYLRSKGVSHIHAMGILANIKGESKFVIAADENGKGTKGIGLFQYTYYTRKRAFLNAVPDYKTNWKGQVQFAIGEGVAPQYFRMQFNSPEEAAYWWMDKWERPSSGVYNDRNKEHNEFIRNFKVPQGKQQAAQQTQVGPVKLREGSLRTGDVLTKTIGRGVDYVQITDTFGSREGNHRGLDIGAPSGTYIALRVDCEVVWTGWQDPNNHRKGYGLLIEVWVPSYGVKLRFGHCSGIINTGRKIPAGTSFARVGSTGESTGPHIHFEYSKNMKNTSGSDGDPSPYVSLILLTSYPSAAAASNVITSSKIAAAQIKVDPNKMKNGDKITTERQGEEVVVIKKQSSAQPISPAVIISGGMNMIPGGSELNTFIKNILFLNLANN